MYTVKNEKGSVLVFITLMIVLLMIMVGMGLDTGQLTYTRSMGQAAVDAAALSAVSALPNRIPADVVERAKAFNSKNDYTGSAAKGIDDVNVSYVKYDFATNQIKNYNEPIATANGVRVALEQETNSAIATPAFLTPLFNLFGASAPAVNNVNVTAVATIISRPAIPIVMWEAQCPAFDGVTEATVKIQMQHPDQKADGNENACWSTFFDCSSGAPDIKAGFQVAGSCTGKSISGNLEIGSLICQNRGQVNTVMKTAEDFFFKTDANKDRWWVVPVIQGGGNCDPNNPTGIKTWAKIYPTAIEFKGNPKYIEAKIACGPNIVYDDLESSLCFSHRLVREPAKGM